jgi:hypothetical protein
MLLIEPNPALPRPLQGGVSTRTSARFTYLAETIARAYEPTDTQLAALQRAYESTGEYLNACTEFEGLLTQVYAHGSRQLGTLVRPSLERDGWDIDLVARLARAALDRYRGDQGTALLLRHLFVALERYAQQHRLTLERHERCVTLIYAGGMRADFAPIIDDPLFSVLHGEHHGRIPDRDLRRYLSTNPRGFSELFDTAAHIRPNFPQIEKLATNFAEETRAEVIPLPAAEEVFGRLLSRYVQLGKIHRNVAFARPQAGSTDLRPSSIFATTLIASGYTSEAPRPHDGPLDLLVDIIDRIPTLFERQRRPDGTEHWVLLNPTAQADNLAESMNDPAKQRAFWAWHSRFRADLHEILDAVEQQKGMDVLLRLVTKAFGAPAANALDRANSAKREENRAAGRGILLAAGTTPIATAARSHTYFGG